MIFNIYVWYILYVYVKKIKSPSFQPCRRTGFWAVWKLEDFLHLLFPLLCLVPQLCRVAQGLCIPSFSGCSLWTVQWGWSKGCDYSGRGWVRLWTGAQSQAATLVVPRQGWQSSGEGPFFFFYLMPVTFVSQQPRGLCHPGGKWSHF